MLKPQQPSEGLHQLRQFAGLVYDLIASRLDLSQLLYLHTLKPKLILLLFS